MKKILTSIVALFLFATLVGCTFGSVKTFTIEFDTDGGSAVEAIELKAGAEIKMPAEPTKPGYTFGGWYSDIDLTELFEKPEAMPEESITLYAKWLVTLTFDSNGGSSVDPIVGEPGGIFNIPANPTREGFVFVGWYYDAEYQNKLTYILPRNNATVKARWQVFEEGSAINLSNDWLINDDGSYVISQVEDGVKITTTALKGEWSYVYSVIDGNAKANTTVVAVVQGLAGTTAVLKLEGGNAEANAEISVEFTGEEQRIEWTVEPKNLTSVGGQKFLIFVNGGTVGCGEEPEYIIVKSISLYHTIEADDPQRSILSFMTNGGTEIEPYYLEPGTEIQAPEDPEKEGFIFDGWFKDAQLTEKYEFTVMPQSTTIVYAGWKPAALYLEDCDLMGGEFVALDEGMYQIQNNEDSYVLKKTAEGGAWTCMVLPMAGKKLAGYNLLRVEVQGTKGEQVLFKINDEGAGERYVTLNGAVQTFELEFDFDLNPDKSLVVFLKPGIEGESGEVTITKLAYANYHRYINLLVDGLHPLDENVYEMALVDGELSVKKVATEGVEWSCIALQLEGVDFFNFDAVKVRLMGPAGEQFLVKANDNGAGEQWITCDGTVQEILYKFAFEFDKAKNTIVLFANPGQGGTGNEFVIYELALIMTTPAVEPEEPQPVEKDHDVDLMGGEFVALDPTMYAIQNNEDSYVLKKTEEGTEWTCMVLPMAGKELAGLNLLRVEVQGTAGEQVLFKINDEGAGERYVTLTGEKQLLELAFDLELNPAKSLVVFLKPGQFGESGEVTITKLAYSNYSVLVDVLSYEIKPERADLYDLTQEEGKLTVAKHAEGGQWDWFGTEAVAALDGKEMTGFDVELKGAEGEKILLKLNDSFEEWVTCTGEVQHLHFNKSVQINGGKRLFVFFANPGDPGSGNSFEITKLVIQLAEVKDEEEAPAEKDVNLMGKQIESLGAGEYEIENNEDSYTLKKTAQAGEWSCAALSVSGLDLTGVTVLRVQFQGAEGELVMFKVNDENRGENWVTCTGEVQYLEFAVDFALDNNKKLIFCTKAGTAGESGVLTITKLEYSNHHKLIDLMAYEFEPGEAGIYTLEQAADKLTFAKDGGGEWSWIGTLAYPEFAGKTIAGVQIVVKGPEGEQLLVKANDAFEQWVTCTGEVQSLHLDITGVIDGGRRLMLLFADAGIFGTGNSFEVTKLVLELA